LVPLRQLQQQPPPQQPREDSSSSSSEKSRQQALQQQRLWRHRTPQVLQMLLAWRWMLSHLLLTLLMTCHQPWWLCSSSRSSNHSSQKTPLRVP
jgi:hypothetical protein